MRGEREEREERKEENRYYLNITKVSLIIVYIKVFTY